jgi:hypothetical protein
LQPVTFNLQRTKWNYETNFAHSGRREADA